MKARPLAAALTGAFIVLTGCSKEPVPSTTTGTATSAQAPARPTASGLVTGAPATPPPPPPAPAYPTKLLWGDQHVHTAVSADAGLALTTVTPETAVRFARGEEVKSSTGEPAKLHRALDWVVISDHSDGMGTFDGISTGNPEMMAEPKIKRWHDMMNTSNAEAAKASREVINAQASKTLPKLLMDPKWTKTAWEHNVDVMEKYNEPGKFTAFIGFEWTSNGEVGQNLHRNVVFRDNADKTRDHMPLTTFVSAAPGRKGTDPESLWKWLAEWEAKTGGKALAIPHNADMSNGWMFREKRYDGTPMNDEWAAARARWEPLVEVFQYKGQGEAHPRLSPTDEFANFEVWDTADLAGNAKQPGDIKREYAREALKRGMALQDKLGTNPFKFGMVSGTDTHTGLMTGGEEDNFWGKFVSGKPGPHRWKEVYKKEATYLRKDWTLSAAGITGVWTTENSRAAIWDSMKRKEVYASSGPRISVRFFAGYDFTDDDAKGDVAATGYAKGVPMGGDMPAAPPGKAATFLIAAMKDPAGGNLDRVQVVKGWVDASGKTHEKLFDVLLSNERKPGADGKVPKVGNTVDVATAKYTNDIGAPELVGVFKDPEFNPAERAFYYARAIEIPTPRWTDYDAVRYKVKMDPQVPMTIQERVVASPIWYEPAKR